MSTDNKRAFRLKQRLPDLPAGSIFESIKDGQFYQCAGRRYKAADVELDTEFFEEIGVCHTCGTPTKTPQQ